MTDAAASFALQAEQPVHGDPIGSEDIRANCPELLGLHMAVDDIVRRIGDSKAPLEHQTAKKRGMARLILE